MGVYAILSIRRSTVVAQAFDLSSVSYFQRRAAREFIVMISREIVFRMRPSRQSVDHEQYTIHAHLCADDTACVFVCDKDYPTRVAYACMGQLLIDCSDSDRLQELIVEWQDPKRADKLSKVHDDLDRTIDVVRTTIAAVLDRGQRLEDLVARSEDLSASSRLFYQNAADANRCCALM